MLFFAAMVAEFRAQHHAEEGEEEGTRRRNSNRTRPIPHNIDFAHNLRAEPGWGVAQAARGNEVLETCSRNQSPLRFFRSSDFGVISAEKSWPHIADDGADWCVARPARGQLPGRTGKRPSGTLALGDFIIFLSVGFTNGGGRGETSGPVVEPHGGHLRLAHRSDTAKHAPRIK